MWAQELSIRDGTATQATWCPLQLQLMVSFLTTHLIRWIRPMADKDLAILLSSRGSCRFQPLDAHWSHVVCHDHRDRRIGEPVTMSVSCWGGVNVGSPNRDAYPSTVHTAPLGTRIHRRLPSTRACRSTDTCSLHFSYAVSGPDEASLHCS